MRNRAMSQKGKLFLVSGPSGAGKSTLVKKVLTTMDKLSYSVSHTTRPPRNNEIDGQDYFFISQEKFKDMISKEQWLEWAEVHGNYYGTSKKFVEDNLKKGQSILLEIDVQGTEQIMRSSLNPVSIFIMPPSFEVLSQRLRDRATDSNDVIEKRLDNAKAEIARKHNYQYVLINDNLDRAAAEFYRIFEKEIGRP
jgi:guanylate kinase